MNARDRRLLYATSFLRALATGLVGVLLGLYLGARAESPAIIGLTVGAGLAGGTAASLVATLWADRFGRRSFLIGLALLGAIGSGLVAFAPSTSLVLVGAFVGMLNGMGRDRGAALVIEQAMLPQTAPDERRTTAFAWYNVLQDAGQGLGALAVALPAVLGVATQGTELASYRAGVVLHGVLLLATAALYAALSPAIEVGAGAPRRALSAASRGVLWRLCALFAVDSVAGGFLTSALLAVFFHHRFGADAAAIGVLFFLARVANTGSHLLAAWLARRIGLLNTMVFTHIPSSLLLLTVPFAPDFRTAAALFVLREALAEMDVPTRQSYVMAVVRPEERTAASGVTHLVRTAGWAVAPSLAGVLMQGVAFATPLFVAAGMKVAYDLLLWAGFRRIVPPEESPRS